ncbi:TPA: PefC/AfrB family outer membrane usher protein [Salmonella enterica subsp. salamae serovar 28:r:e,n,z15]|nr:PefC/AfrB family outer membrane usher protein [Salmonella enterica subsp. salamae serovar 28:r:e,n,z15]
MNNSFVRVSKKTLLLLVVILHRPAYSEQLDLRFIHGVKEEHTPLIFNDDVQYPPGQYIVDVIFNHQRLGRQVIDILKEDIHELCLPESWIKTAGLPVNINALKKADSVWEPTRQCLYIGRYPAGSVRFNSGAQSVEISVPQVVLSSPENGDNWDYGIPGFRLRYSGNASKNQLSKTQYYGNVDLVANIGRWILSSSSTGFSGQGFQSAQTMLSTAVSTIRGNLELGKTQTRSTILPDFSFYGASVRSDSSMVPWSARGYAPTISGVASSNARITVSQGGYTLSSQVVPPGAYSLNNIDPVSNGDITVTVEEEDGSKTVRTYPVNTLPTLLRAGDFNYNLSFGKRDADSSQVKGVFALGSLDYGFAPLTLSLATILHHQYQSMGGGITRDFGEAGAVEVSTNIARSVFDSHGYNGYFYSYRDEDKDNTSLAGQGRYDRYHNRYNSRDVARPDGPRTGISAAVKYAKSFGKDTSLQLLSWHYAGENYEDFASFSPAGYYSNNKRKERYEAVLTRNLADATNVSISSWTESYRGSAKNDTGINASLNTSIRGIFMNVNGSYSSSQWYKNDYSLSVSMSIPFSLFGSGAYSSSSVSWSPRSGSRFSSGMSASPTENLNYNLSAGTDRYNQSVSASANYNLPAVQTGASVTQYHSRYGSDQTAGTINAAGNVLGTTKSGVMFTRNQNNTLAVVSIKDLQGVTFNGSSPTDSSGVTIVPVNPYNKNKISVNTDNIPDNIDILDTVHDVTPTNNAIVYREFNYVVVKRYILKVMMPDGKPVVAGATATTRNGLNAGFVTSGGILLANLIDEPESLIISVSPGETCTVNMKGVKYNQNKATRVYCSRSGVNDRVSHINNETGEKD